MTTLSSTPNSLLALPRAWTLFQSELTPVEKSGAGAIQAGMIRTMADFAKEAYNLSHPGATEYVTFNDFSPHAGGAYHEVINHHWTPVNFSSLVPVLNNGVIQSGMLSDGFYINANAAACVARCGDAIVLSFRGTNDNGKDGVINPADPSNVSHPDVDQWGKMPDYYALLSPLIATFDAYVAANGINKVYVTGHSMGGTMALEYMSNHPGTQYHAVTFGASPFGQSLFLDISERKDYAPDSRITQLEIAKDPVPMAFDVENLLGDTNARPGHVINFSGDGTLDTPDIEQMPFVPDYYARDANHSMDYYRQITDSVDANSWSRILAGTQPQTILLAGQQESGTSNFIVDGKLSGTNTHINNGNNTLTSVDSKTVYGGKGNDTLTAGANNTLLLGGSGADVLHGQTGKDKLIGGSGNDNLSGGAAHDRLVGGLGKDVLTGGLGRDGFKFNNVAETGLTATTRDTVSDFHHNQGDKINLFMIDADRVAAGNNAFASLTVGGAFSGSFANPGDLYFDKVHHILYGNNDTDAAADFSILLSGVTALSLSDFIL